MRIIFILISATLAGCATPYMWKHPDHADKSRFDKDRAQCQYEVSAATQQTDYSYRSILGQEMDRATRQRDLGILCMKAKGYTQQPVDNTVIR